MNDKGLEQYYERCIDFYGKFMKWISKIELIILYEENISLQTVIFTVTDPILMNYLNVN